MADAIMCPEIAHAPTAGFMLSVSASRPHTIEPPSTGVPSLSGRFPADAATWVDAVEAPFDDPQATDASATVARTATSSQ